MNVQQLAEKLYKDVPTLRGAGSLETATTVAEYLLENFKLTVKKGA